MLGRQRPGKLKSRRVVHKSTGGMLNPIPEPVDPVGNAPSSSLNTVAHLSNASALGCDYLAAVQSIRLFSILLYELNLRFRAHQSPPTPPSISVSCCLSLVAFRCTRYLLLVRLFQHTTICWGLGLKRQVRKVQRIADASVRCRSAGGSEAKESLEGSHGLLSAIVPKDELVEVGLELGAADPVMSADEP